MGKLSYRDKVLSCVSDKRDYRDIDLVEKGCGAGRMSVCQQGCRIMKKKKEAICRKCNGEGGEMVKGPVRVETLDDFGSTCTESSMWWENCDKCGGTGKAKKLKK